MSDAWRWPSGPTSRGTTITVNRSNAWTFNGGMRITALDLNLTAQTGYTTSTSLAFEFNSGGNRYLCGNQGNPGGTPGLLQVQLSS